MEMQMKKEDKIISLRLVLLFLFFVIANLVWFFEFRDGIISGDDIGIPFSFGGNKTFWEMVFAGAEKYRPVINFVWVLEYKLFGLNYLGYYLFNIILHSLTSTSLFFVMEKITKDKITSFVVVMVYQFSFLCYYNITQALGSMEELCLFFLVWIVYSMYLIYKEQKISYLCLLAIVSMFVVFTHERFLVLMLTNALVVFFFYRKEYKKKIGALCIVEFPFLFNLLLKKLIFDNTIMVGTGGTYIDINIKSIFSYVLESVALVFGINIGPEYLNGYTWNYCENNQKVLSVLLATFFIVLIFFYLFKVIRMVKRERVEEIKKFVTAVFFVGCLMISYCVTIRVEMRWVYAPFLVFVMYIGYMLSKVCLKRGFKLTLLVILLVLSLQYNWNHKEHSQGVYFNASMNAANTIYDLTIGEYGNTISQYNLYVLKTNTILWAMGGEEMLTLNQFMDEPLNYFWISSIDEVDLSDDRNIAITVDAMGQIIRLNGGEQ